MGKESGSDSARCEAAGVNMGSSSLIALSAAAAWLALGCNGSVLSSPADASPDALVVHAAPLIVYSSCAGQSGPTTNDRCVFVRVTAGGQTLLAEQTICGPKICDLSQGYGEGPSGIDGQPTTPLLLRCLPDNGVPIHVDVCAPGYQPLSMTMPLQALVAPDVVPIGARDLQSCPPAPRDFIRATFASIEITYPLQPIEAGTADGGDVCPLAPADAGAPAAALTCPCPN
jgi:hypothetical protein